MENVPLFLFMVLKIKIKDKIQNMESIFHIETTVVQVFSNKYRSGLSIHKSTHNIFNIT